MPIFHNFILIEPTREMQEIAVHHAKRRTDAIVRQFIPRHAPLSHIESNYIGALGEIVVHDYFGLPIELKDNYADNQVDSGDIRIKGKMYDIKTEATPVRYSRACRSISPTTRSWSPAWPTVKKATTYQSRRFLMGMCRLSCFCDAARTNRRSTS